MHRRLATGMQHNCERKPRTLRQTHSILDAMLATLAGGRLRRKCSGEGSEPSSGARMMGSIDTTSAEVGLSEYHSLRYCKLSDHAACVSLLKLIAQQPPFTV